MKAKSILVSLLVLALIVVYFACNIIEPYQEGVVFKQSGPKILKPGFYVLVPFVNPIKKIDLRTQVTGIQGIAVRTQDKADMIVNITVFWSVSDSMAYAKSVNADSGQVDSWLKQNIAQAVQQKLGADTMSQLLGLPSNSLSPGLQSALSQSASKMGIQIIDINIQNISYAPAMLDRVYQAMQASVKNSVDQMNAAGIQQAAEITSQGKAAAAGVVNNALIQAATIKGQSEAKAQIIYNQAYQKDPQFYAFWRSMQLYQQLLASKNTVLVVKPEGQFLQYFNSPTRKSPS